MDIESNILSKHCKNVERNRSMDLTKQVLHEAMVENTGIANDLCDLQPKVHFFSSPLRSK